jgi:predicted RecB family nuclease
MMGHMSPHVPITDVVFAAYLKCEMKAFLLRAGDAPTDPEIDNWQRSISEAFKASALERLRSNLPPNDACQGMPTLRALRRQVYSHIFEPLITRSEFSTQLHALERQQVGRGVKDTTYCPIRFLPNEKLAPSDKLLVAYDALAVSRLTGRTPPTARIIHGSDYRSTTVQLPKLVKEAQPLADKCRIQHSTGSPPPLTLNKHCPECQFRSRCRQIAVEKDDLSLLTTLSERERKKLNRKGITTVAQFSCTYRPRRRSARNRMTATKHQPALKALAIQANRIHVVGTPTFSITSGTVYLDVEGVPDREFYYLTGMRYRRGDEDLHLSFWADDPSGEREMWVSLLRALEQIPDVHLVHYGSYETQFLKRMKARYCESPEDIELVDRLIASSANLLNLTYAHIYFPTYSNGLKDIASYLGFRWSEENASGRHALMWRSEWEGSADPDLKQALTTYNAEDCEAAQKVAEAIAEICRPRATTANSILDPVDVHLLVDKYKRMFRPLDCAIPEFKQINNAAYWDYQRAKVYVRSDGNIRKVAEKGIRQNSKGRSRVNKVVCHEDLRPSHCPRCGSTSVNKHERCTQEIADIVLSPSGVRRSVIRSVFYRYRCWTCHKYLLPYQRRERYGNGLRTYIIYMIIQMGISQHKLCDHLHDVFDLHVDRRAINRIKIGSANRFEQTYERLRQRVASGELVHADETRVPISGESHYVWVFTNLEEVIFVYSASRDASTARETLHGFNGVLVSDFYAGYESIECVQQKCLIHLMRDINDDVLKQPFNTEMEELARAFALLLKPMVETIDRFGLKAYHLRKHKRGVTHFYTALAERNYKTEVAVGYKKRFERYRDTLFTFLDYDDVPWNNNNAEHAVKAFVRLRNVIGGSSTPKGIRDYLVLLSISETCKYKGVSFLDFLRSGEIDVDIFAAHTGRARCTTRTPNTKGRGGGDQKAAYIVSDDLP